MSSSETEQPAQPARRRIFTRPAVLGGKKNTTTSQQRQTSSNGATVQSSPTTTSPIPASNVNASLSDAAGQPHRRAATSLGHHLQQSSSNNKQGNSNTASGAHHNHQARQTSYDYASRASILGSSGAGVIDFDVSLHHRPRHSNELSARTQQQQQQQQVQQQQYIRTSSSTDGHNGLPNQNSRLHQVNCYITVTPRSLYIAALLILIVLSFATGQPSCSAG